MTTRPRAPRGQRQSWRDRDAPISSGLLFYRRLVATTLVVLFAAAFIAILYVFWPRGVSWTSEHLVIAEYDPDSAPPLNYADRQKQAWTAALPSRDVAGGATQSDVLSSSVAKLAGGHARRNDPLLVYVAGHGCSLGDEAFLYASDLDPSGVQSPGVNVRELLAAVVQHPAQQTVLILDSGPLEHDLRLGTAVNGFPEILEREVGKIPLADGELLIVLASHHKWERAFVSPIEKWSIFGYFVNEALASAEFNADRLRFDRGRSNGQISVLELAGYVQQHVSSWVWQGSQQRRTQRPLLLYAKGTARRVIDLVHGHPSADAGKDLRDELDRLILPAVKRPLADTATAAFVSLESAAYGQEPSMPPSAAKADEVSKDSIAEKQSKNGGSPDQKETPAKEAKSAPEPPPPDLRPEWMRAHAGLLQVGFGAISADADWTAADYAPAAVRRAWRDILYAQQKQLAGATSDRVNLSAPRPSSWDPLHDWQADPATYQKLRRAARIRNAAMLRLEQYIGGLDAAEGVAHDDTRLTDELEALWLDFSTSLSRLADSMDQEVFLDTPSTDPNGPTINLSAGSQSGSVQDIITAGHVTEESARKLTARIEELVLARTSSPGVTRWLSGWELAQAVPLSAWNIHADDPAGDNGIPPLSLAPPATPAGDAASADKQPPATSTPPRIILPTSNDLSRIEQLLRQRRKRWLDRQAIVANLLRHDSAAPALSVAGDTDTELNAAALQIAERHRSAVKWLRANFGEGAATADACSQWTADRVLRLALAVEHDATEGIATPMPLNVVQRKEQPYLLRVEGPADTIDLELGKEQPVRFTIHHGSERPFDPALADFRLQIPAGLKAMHAGKPIVSGLYRWQQLAAEDGNQIDLSVTATRELEILAGGKLEDPLKSLSLILTLGSVTSAKATSTAQFRLPGAPHLDVLVAGYEGTIEHAPEPVSADAAPDREFHFNPPSSTSDASSVAGRGRVRVHLRPMPQGETTYRLHLVNRSTVPRNVLVRWHVLDDPRPSTEWSEVIGQIGEASQKSRLRPELLPPGRRWLVPLYEEDQPHPPPPSGAPPAATPAAPPPPTQPKPPVAIGSGLVCQLTDLNDENWSQWIWFTAEPRSPDTYVIPSSRLTGTTGVAETVIQDHPASSALLPPGRTTVIRGNPRSGLDARRVAFSQKEVKGVLTKGDLTLIAQLPPRSNDDDTPIPFSFDVDGYPRALRFLARPNSVQSIADRGGVELRLLAVADPPMPGKEDSLLSAEQLFFAKAPKLRYEMEADFPIQLGTYAVVLSRADEFPQQLAEFYADRRFDIECRRQPPEEAAKSNLSLVCRISELGGPLDWLNADTGFEPPMRIRLRAEVTRYDPRDRFEPLTPPVRHEVEIVLDNQPPRLVKSPPATLDWDRRQRLPVIPFTLSDADRAGDGSGVASVEWGTMPKGEGALADPQPLPIPEGRTGEVPLHIGVPQKLLAMEGKPVDILLVVRDRAGNVFGPETLQTINVKAPPERKQAPKGSDSKK